MRISFGGDEIVLELYNGDGCTALQIYLKPLNWVHFMVCEFYLTFSKLKKKNPI